MHMDVRYSGFAGAKTSDLLCSGCPCPSGFAASSEKTSPDQRELFNEAEQDQPESDKPEQVEPNITVPAHSQEERQATSP